MAISLPILRIRIGCALALLLGYVSLAEAQLPAPAPLVGLTPAFDNGPEAPRTREPHAGRARWLSWALFWPFDRRPASVVETVTLPPTPEEMERIERGLASLVEVAAVKIKTDEAAAPARRAAIRYLASVRCHYFPEAEAALIAALRADRNESVRWEAAQALASCCCCTSKTMEALLATATGSEHDGNAAETSDRVKTAANSALQRYASRGMPVPHPDALPPAMQAAAKELQLMSYTTSITTHDGPQSIITDAERHFAETAGTQRPLAKPAPARIMLPAAPRPSASLGIVDPVPSIRLTPIGIVPPQPGN